MPLCFAMQFKEFDLIPGIYGYAVLFPRIYIDSHTKILSIFHNINYFMLTSCEISLLFSLDNGKHWSINIRA